MEKHLNIPQLRFPEFDGEWEVKKLREVIYSLESGVSVNSIDEPVGNDYEMGVLKTSCIASGRFMPEENKTILPEEIKRAKLNPEKDTIIISRMNTPQLVGESGYVDNNYSNLFLPDRLWMARINREENSVKLISIILASTKTKTKLSNIGTGTSGSMKNISQPNFLNISISLPSFPEQIRIAQFLTAIDQKITQLKQKKKLLKQYKKGVMQKMFSQEIRFKDENGKELPNWEKKKLGDVLIKNSKKNKNQICTLVQSVSNKYGFVNQSEYFEDRIVASKDLSNYYLIQKGNFAYNPSRINVGSLAYKKDNHTSVISPLYISFSANNKYLNDEFLLVWFSSEQFIKQMNNSFEGSVRNTLSYESLINIEITIPYLFEQTPIANFLSAIDEKINHCQMQIEKTELWKKGLLQQMFC